MLFRSCYLPEEDSILLDHPLMVEKVSQKRSSGHSDGFTLTEWIHSTYETMFVIPKSAVVTMSELDKRIEGYYIRMINQEEDSDINVKPQHLSSRMGYLGSVNNTKKYLEDIFKRS